MPKISKNSENFFVFSNIQNFDYTKPYHEAQFWRLLKEEFQSRDLTINNILDCLKLLNLKFSKKGLQWLKERLNLSKNDSSFSRMVQGLEGLNSKELQNKFTEKKFFEREKIFVSLDPKLILEESYLENVEIPLFRKYVSSEEQKKTGEKGPTGGKFGRSSAKDGNLFSKEGYEKKISFYNFIKSKYYLLRSKFGLNPSLNFWRDRFIIYRNHFGINFVRYKKAREMIRKKGEQLSENTGYYYLNNKWIVSINYNDLPIGILEEFSLMPLSEGQMRFLNYLAYLSKIKKYTREFVKISSNKLIEMQIFKRRSEKSKEVNDLVSRGIIEENPIFFKGSFPFQFRFAEKYLEQLKQKQTFTYPFIRKERAITLEWFEKETKKEQKRLENRIKDFEKESQRLGWGNEAFIHLIYKIARRKFRQAIFNTVTDCVLANKILIPKEIYDNILSARDGRPLFPELKKLLNVPGEENANYLLTHLYLLDIETLRRIYDFVKEQSQGPLFSLKYCENFPKPARRKFRLGEVAQHRVQKINQELPILEEKQRHYEEATGLGSEEAREFYQEVKKDLKEALIGQEKDIFSYSDPYGRQPGINWAFYDQTKRKIVQNKDKICLLKERNKVYEHLFEKQNLIYRAERDFLKGNQTTNKESTLEKYIYGYYPQLKNKYQQVEERLIDCNLSEKGKSLQAISDEEIRYNPIKLKVWLFYQNHVHFDVANCVRENSEFFATNKDRFTVLSYIRQILTKNPRITIGEKSGRVYHPLVNMPKTFRKYALIDGKPVQEIDIKNCHPTLMQALFVMTDLQLQSLSRLASFKIKDSSLSEEEKRFWSREKNICQNKRDQIILDKDQFQKDLLEQDFYSRFVTENYDRKTVKVAFEVALALNPLWRLIWKYKEPDSDTRSALTERIRRALEKNETLKHILDSLWKQKKPVQCLLQQIESLIVLKGAYLSEAHSEFLPMHDGAIFAQGNEKAAQRFQELVSSMAKALYNLEIQFSLK